MGNKAAVATVKAKADRHAEDVLPIIEDIWHSGTQTLGGIATALNERGILTMRKAKWYPATVKSLWRAPVCAGCIQRTRSPSLRAS